MKPLFTHTFLTSLLFISFAIGSKAQDAKIQQLSQSNIPSQFPLKGEDFQTMSSPYGYRIHPIHKIKRMHSGIDLVADKGSAVFATASGIVEQVNFHKKGYGNHITIKHSKNLKTMYAHLWIMLVKKGEKVAQGQLIGFVGDTGLATGPHLHYEIHLDNKKLNPMLIWKHFLRNKA